MTEKRSIANSPAQAVVFLETLAAHIRGMAEAVTTEARVNPAELDTTRQYAALDWHNEAIAVMFAAEHRPTFL